MRRLDIGVSSYRNPEKLRVTLESIEQRSVTDWRCLIYHNPSEDDGTAWDVIKAAMNRNSRFLVAPLATNVGYAGAVAAFQREASTEYLAYCDNDINILTDGWDEQLCFRLDANHEIGMIFPNGGAYQIDRGAYTEVMWGVGFCWVLNRAVMAEVGVFDTELGHHEEVDYQLRLRMAGWKCAALPQVRVQHDAAATNDPVQLDRINAGIVRFVDKWCARLCGKHITYHSPNTLRFEDWPVNALYLEEYWKERMPGLNLDPLTKTLEGREYDLIMVPRLKNFYRGRIV